MPRAHGRGRLGTVICERGLRYELAGATADEDGGEGIAVAMELRNHGVTELRKQAAWLRINGFTNQRN